MRTAALLTGLLSDLLLLPSEEEEEEEEKERQKQSSAAGRPAPREHPQPQPRRRERGLVRSTGLFSLLRQYNHIPRASLLAFALVRETKAGPFGEHPCTQDMPPRSVPGAERGGRMGVRAA